MRYIGIDYGTKRVGIAHSDEGGTFVFPDTTLDPKEALIYLREKAEKENELEFVIGIPGTATESQNPVERAIRFFAETLSESTGREVHFVEEAFTSFEAHGRKGKEQHHARQSHAPQGENVDAKAAALLLERFLAKKK